MELRPWYAHSVCLGGVCEGVLVLFLFQGTPSLLNVGETCTFPLGIRSLTGLRDPQWLRTSLWQCQVGFCTGRLPSGMHQSQWSHIS